MTTRYRNIIPSAFRKTPRPFVPDAGLHFSNCMVYFDFDNTITSFDVLDGIIEQFSINRDWVAYEAAWKQGKIGSRQCLEGQLRSIRVTKKQLLEYLCTIKVDAHFHKLLMLLRAGGINPVILSDSFSFLIEYILQHNGIHGIKVYSNQLKIHKSQLVPSFPYTNSLCSHCAHCKTSTLSSEAFKDKKVLYIGDGLSDVCPAHHADIVFAKSTLLKHFQETERDCLAFTDFGDIYNYFKEHIHDAEGKYRYGAGSAAIS
ncbi:MAG: MtnX-like HAD-IB family phosphatase [Pseudomonadota bacterium]